MLGRIFFLLTIIVIVKANEGFSVSMQRHHQMGISRTFSRRLNEKMKLNSNGSSVPAWGDVFPIAIYWVFIDVGTPPIKFPVALDTGSGDVDFPMVGCSTCIPTPPNNKYDVSKSSTGAASCPFGCTFSNSYETCDLSDPTAICTISGNYYQDLVTFSNTGIKPVSIIFGGINYQTSNFDQFKNIDGVVGLTGGDSSSNLFQSLVSAGYVKEDVFSMCFVEGSKSNGTFTIGGIDSRLYSGTIQYTENVGGDYEYDIQLVDIQIAGVTIDNTQDQVAILDSGTNVLLLTDEMFQSMKSIFLSNCSNNPLVGICTDLSNGTLFDGACFPLTQSQMDQYPLLHIRLNGFSLTMQPKDYLIFISDPRLKCLGIRNTGPDGDTGIFIIGDTTMQEYYTVFDRTNNQIGFAPVNAKNCGSI